MQNVAFIPSYNPYSCLKGYFPSFDPSIIYISFILSQYDLILFNRRKYWHIQSQLNRRGLRLEPWGAPCHATFLFIQMYNYSLTQSGPCPADRTSLGLCHKVYFPDSLLCLHCQQFFSLVSTRMFLGYPASALLCLSKYFVNTVFAGAIWIKLLLLWRVSHFLMQQQLFVLQWWPSG